MIQTHLHTFFESLNEVLKIHFKDSSIFVCVNRLPHAEPFDNTRIFIQSKTHDLETHVDLDFDDYDECSFIEFMKFYIGWEVGMKILTSKKRDYEL